MRPVALAPHSRITFRIAADARLGPTDYLDDQIWQLAVDGGDPAALAIETSYGLRSKGMRIFPSFRHAGVTRTDPADFTHPPTVELHLPNYLRVACLPFPYLSVKLEYWVPDSKTLAGRMSLTNVGSKEAGFRLRLHAVLRPGQGGEPMGEAEVAGSTVLVGRSDGLRPIVFLSGAAHAEQIAHPALYLERDLGAGESMTATWVEAGLTDPGDGIERARELAKAPWDASIARIERANAGIVDVNSGHDGWDLALHRAQVVGLGSLLAGGRKLPRTSFVMSRGPDHGFSRRSSGRDHPESWSGQDVFAARQLCWQLLPCAPGVAADILRNYLHVQVASGEIDSRPGLAGQRGGSLAPPLLAGIAWDIYRQTSDRAFLRSVYQPLLEFVASWFKRRHDRDGDGAPEWDNAVQSGYPESPVFSPWLPDSGGLSPSSLESPDLLAYLYHECQCMAAMADALGRTEDLAALEAKSTGLRQAIDRAWSEQSSSYLPLDRDLHVAQDGEPLGEGNGSFALKIGRKFDPMVRLSIRISGPEGEARTAHVTIHGRGRAGRFSKERIDSRDFNWFWEAGAATSANTFASIDRIEVGGLSEGFRTRVSLADHKRQDIGSLLPLWSGAVDHERAALLVEHALNSPDFLHPGGVSACSAADPAYGQEGHPAVSGVRMVWNGMLGRGLLGSGHRELAVDLVGRLLDNASRTLESEGAFRAWYSPDGGRGFGEADSIEGLAPLSLFMACLGVCLVSPWSVELSGSNPFDHAVTIRWKGLVVQRGADGSTIVTFPDGRQIEVADEGSQRVERIR